MRANPMAPAARSASSDPPERLDDDGSTASTATVRPRRRHSGSSAERSVDSRRPAAP